MRELSSLQSLDIGAWLQGRYFLHYSTTYYCRYLERVAELRLRTPGIERGLSVSTLAKKLPSLEASKTQ